jgi:hypothetical protein
MAGYDWGEWLVGNIEESFLLGRRVNFRSRSRYI